MENLIVGVAQVSLIFRQNHSLKDKRQILMGLKQKLKNLGFSVTECGYQEDPKRGNIGFVFVGTEPGGVEKRLDEGFRIFIGNYQVASRSRDLIDVSGEETLDFGIEEREGKWGDEY